MLASMIGFTSQVDQAGRMGGVGARLLGAVLMVQLLLVLSVRGEGANESAAGMPETEAQLIDAILQAQFEFFDSLGPMSWEEFHFDTHGDLETMRYCMLEADALSFQSVTMNGDGGSEVSPVERATKFDYTLATFFFPYGWLPTDTTFADLRSEEFWRVAIPAAYEVRAVPTKRDGRDCVKVSFLGRDGGETRRLYEVFFDFEHHWYPLNGVLSNRGVDRQEWLFYFAWKADVQTTSETLTLPLGAGYEIREEPDIHEISAGVIVNYGQVNPADLPNVGMLPDSFSCAEIDEIKFADGEGVVVLREAEAPYTSIDSDEYLQLFGHAPESSIVQFVSIDGDRFAATWYEFRNWGAAHFAKSNLLNKSPKLAAFQVSNFVLLVRGKSVPRDRIESLLRRQNARTPSFEEIE